jgi:CRP-like cAMP-binding protein
MIYQSTSATKLAPARVSKTPLDVQSSTKPAVRLFMGLSPKDIANIMGSAVVRKFPAGRIIVRTDDLATHLFLLKTGSLNYYRVTEDGREVLIIRLSAGETFGLGTLLAKPISYIGTAETLRETEVYAWEQPLIRQYVRKHPLLAENALQIGLEYIRLYSDRHLALVSSNAEDRLMRMLALLGIPTGHQHPRGLEVHITNEHLGSLADISSFNVSRLLKKLERKGSVEKSRGKVVIRFA